MPKAIGEAEGVARALDDPQLPFIVALAVQNGHYVQNGVAPTKELDAFTEQYVEDARVSIAAIKAAIATLPQEDPKRIKVLEEALEEAMRRYPAARDGLAWFAAASGLSAGEVTQEVRDWANAALAQSGDRHG